MPWPHPRTWLLGAALAAAAAVAVLGGLHAHGHADAFVPVLVSLQRWTPFYWEQERFGMLVPLLALPVHDPLWNLLLQRFLMAAASLAGVVLLARHVLAGRDWWLAGLLAAAALLAGAPAPWLFEWLVDQPYGLALGLALLGLAVAEPDAAGRRGRARLAAGAALVLAAHWVNAAAGLLLLPLAAARALVDRAERAPVRDRLLVDAGLLALGLVAAQAGIQLHPVLTGAPRLLALGFLPVTAWPGAWIRFASDAWAVGSGWAGALAGAAALGVALLARDPATRPALPRLLLRSGALLAAALAYALFAGTLRWVAQNGFHWRYLAPSAVLVHVAAVALLAEPLARSRLGALAARLAVASPLLATLVAFGPPSLARARADLDRTSGALTPAVLAARCDALAGDYWTVWPAVWHVARVRGDAGTFHGVTYRARPTLPRWRHDGARVCVPAGQEAEAEHWLVEYGLAGEVTRVPLPP